jgi:hypothetical protein
MSDEPGSKKMTREEYVMKGAFAFIPRIEWLERENERLQEQLKIAVEALEVLLVMSTGPVAREFIREALKKIRGGGA